MGECVSVLETAQKNELELAQQQDTGDTDVVNSDCSEPSASRAAAETDGSATGGALRGDVPSTEAPESRSSLQERINSLLPNSSPGSPLLLHRNSSSESSRPGSPAKRTPFSPRKNFRRGKIVRKQIQLIDLCHLNQNRK